MGIFNKLSQAFDNRIETSDHHADQMLRTHYYKTSKSTLFKACLELADKHQDMTVINKSEDRGEISAELKGKRAGLIVLTIIPVMPFHTAADLTLSFDKGFQLPYGKKLVADLYSRLDSQLPLSQKRMD